MSEQPHQRCPHPNCDSSDAFSFNTAGYGKCHSCGNPYPKRGVQYEGWVAEAYPLPNPDRRQLYEEKAITYSPIKEIKYAECRGITKETMQKYDCKTYFGYDGEAVKQEYVYDGIRKYRVFPKTFYIEGGSITSLWGMDKFNAGSARYVTVTEGELDAMSAYQMLGSQYPVVSLPSATPSRAFWDRCKPWLDSFEKIYLSVDNDDAGNEVARKISQMFPNKVYRIPHDKYKDANEFLVDGAYNQFRNSWFSAKKYTPSNVLNTSDQFIKLFNESPQYSYLPTGITELDSKIRGLMQGHYHLIKAPTGIGKTEFLRYLEYNILSNHPDVPIAMWHLEETKIRSILGLASYELKKNVTRKDIIEEYGIKDEVEGAIKKLTERENLFQFYLPSTRTVDEFIDQIRYFAVGCGCKYVFFEPIQDIVTGVVESAKEALLSDLGVRLSDLAAELDIGIVTIAHENDNGDIKYCRTLGQKASFIIRLMRDKYAEDEDERNTTQLFIEKNRPCSLEGNAGTLRFDLESFTLREESFDV